MTVAGRQERQDGVPQKCREMQAAYVFLCRSKSSRPANSPRSAIVLKARENRVPTPTLPAVSPGDRREGSKGMVCVCSKLQVCDGNGVRDGITSCSALLVLRMSSVIP